MFVSSFGRPDEVGGLSGSPPAPLGQGYDLDKHSKRVLCFGNSVFFALTGLHKSMSALKPIGDPVSWCRRCGCWYPGTSRVRFLLGRDVYTLYSPLAANFPMGIYSCYAH